MLRFQMKEQVLIRGLREWALLGEIVSLRPLRAVVTEDDKVFHGAETTTGIRKLNPKTCPLKKKTA